MVIRDSCDPALLLQQLVRFDTSNPPGNESECIRFVGELLDSLGFEIVFCSRLESRPNLLATFHGKRAEKLLLVAHADVVPAFGDWTYPPFSGRIVDGTLWGRGALDMKGILAMYLAAIARHIAAGDTFDRGLKFGVFSDEENGSEYGAQFVSEHRGEWFKDVGLAVGEQSANPFLINDVKFVPIQVAEKQGCWISLRFDGSGGHASVPLTGRNVVKEVSVALDRLADVRLPSFPCASGERMLSAIESWVPPHQRSQVVGEIRGHLEPALVPQKVAERLAASMRPTVSVTEVLVGEKINSHPSSAVIRLDCRLLPGQNPSYLTDYLSQELADLDVSIDVDYFDPYTEPPENGQLELLESVVRESFDESAVPFPFLAAGASDARFLQGAGVEVFGFPPVDLPSNMDSTTLMHGVNERIPVSALEFGTRCMQSLFSRYVTT